MEQSTRLAVKVLKVEDDRCFEKILAVGGL